MGLESGDVETLPLSRARVRWPDYKHCVHAAREWTHTLGLHDLLTSSEVALMACRGARYHHDGAQYGGSAFCNQFLSEDNGLDAHFASTGHRIPLKRGTVMIFDNGQPHAVIDRRSGGFNAADFPRERDCTQVFLTWELSVENSNIAKALQIAFDTEPATALLLDAEQVLVNGTPANVCPESGRWL